MRERPEKPTEFGAACVRPTLRINGARFVTFHGVDKRVVVAAVHLSGGVDAPEADEVRSATTRPLAIIDLTAKDAVERVTALAARVYEARTGRAGP